MITREKLKEMSEMDFEDIDSENIVDINDVKLNDNLPYDKKLESYLNQIINPYCYRDNGMIVRVRFASEGKSLEQCLADYYCCLK